MGGVKWELCSTVVPPSFGDAIKNLFSSPVPSRDVAIPKSFVKEADACYLCSVSSGFANGNKCYSFPCAGAGEQYCLTNEGYAYTSLPSVAGLKDLGLDDFAECVLELPPASCPTVTTPKTFSTRKAACMTCSNAQSTVTDPNVKCYSFGCTEELCGVSDGYMYTPYNKMPNFGDDPQECSSSLEDALTVETEGDACLMCNALLSTPNALKCYVFPCADNEATCSVDTGHAYTPYNQAPTMVKDYKECSV